MIQLNNIHYMDTPHFIFHSSIDRHARFQVLTTVQNAAMNMDVQMSVHVAAFNSFEYIPGSGTAG